MNSITSTHIPGELSSPNSNTAYANVSVDTTYMYGINFKT